MKSIQPLGWGDLSKFLDERTNGALVTVIGAFTTVVASPSFDVATGDRIFVAWRGIGTKAAVAGKVADKVEKIAGTASVFFVSTSIAPIHEEDNVAAASVYQWRGTAVYRVGSSGTLTLAHQALSLGGNLTVAIADGALRVNVIRG